MDTNRLLTLAIIVAVVVVAGLIWFHPWTSGTPTETTVPKSRVEAEQKVKTITQEAEQQTVAAEPPPSKPGLSSSVAKDKAAEDPFTGKWGVNPFCSQYMQSITFNGNMATIFRSRRRYSPKLEEINCQVKSRLLGVAIPKIVVSCASGGDQEISYYRDELLLPQALVGDADWTLTSSGGRFKKCNSQ